MVLKSEEPGSKQKLAMEYGYNESICHDMINHLVNDIAVMGAKPLAVLDTIVCGKAEKETIKSFIKGISEACRENECDLVGGETSIQPEVVNQGIYILTASIAGCAEIDLNQLKTLPIFSYIKEAGNISEAEMLSTFNCGAGLLIVAKKDAEQSIISHIRNYYDCYKIGEIKTGNKKIIFKNHIMW